MRIVSAFAIVALAASSVFAQSSSTVRPGSSPSAEGRAVSSIGAPRVMDTTAVTIAQARVDANNDLIPDYSVSGDTLKIFGVVTSPSYGGTGYSSYFIQDATAGINVYSPTPMTFSMGDSVFVIGTITQNRGLTEIKPLVGDSTCFGVVKHNAVMPKPKVVSVAELNANAESYEGQLVEVDAVQKVSGTWPALNSNKSIYVANLGGTDSVQVFIDKDTDIDGTTEPAYPVNIVGVVSQYSSGSSVYDDGYELEPRDSTDFQGKPATIAEARKDDDHDNVPDHSVTGDTLIIQGVVTSPNYLLSSNATSFYVQDGTAGIDVYAGGIVLDYAEGDSVFVVGKVLQFNGLTEISPLVSDSLHFGVISHNASVPAPKLLTLHDFLQNAEMYEGQLVQIDSLYKVSGTWPKENSNASIYVVDFSKADTVQMYIDKDTDIDGTMEPLFPINLVGIAGQYSSSGVGGYEILPRDTSDYWKVPGIASVVSIARARQDLNKDNVPDYSLTGDTLMVYGVVTSPNYLLSSHYTSYYIQDATAGIDVYVGSGVMDFNMGDSVFVIGTIDQFNGVTEIAPLEADSVHFGLLKHNAIMPTPKRLTLAQYMQNAESYEGQLVEIDTLFKISGTWPSADQNASIYLTDFSHSDTVQLYIDKDSEVDGTVEPEYPISVIAVASQYSSSGVGGFELLPRVPSDIMRVYGIPTVLSIAEARQDKNHDWVPDYSVSGDTVMIFGVVTTPNLGAPSYSSYFIQDSVAGIDVYSPTAVTFKIGDSVAVVGTILQHNGLTEIEPLKADSAHFGYLKHNATIPAPKVLSTADFVKNAETYEGQLITLDTLVKASGNWPAAGSNGSVYLTDMSGVDTVQLFVSKATTVAGAEEPKYPIEVTGVVSQYGSTDSTGYELIPRDTSDITLIVISGVADRTNDIPKTFYLKQNYPNPFNPATTIEFGLPKEAHVQIAVYNVLGQRVTTLVDEVMKAGNHRINFNGSRLASGVYFYVMRTGDQLLKQKMLLMK